VRIATWNVNGLRARLEFVAHWLRARRPDVVGLQELKVEDQRFPYAEIEALGYHSAVSAQRSWNGVAILSREPAVIVERGLPGQEDLGARLLTAQVGGLSFTTIYCPNGKSVGHEDFPIKLAWLDALVAHFATRGSESAVVCGDFNVAPGPLDSWDEERLRGSIHHTDAERARIRRLNESGLLDVARALHPATPIYSWWDYRGGAFHRNQGLRIDLVLATASVARRVRSAEIDRDYRKKKDGLIPSDHAPVIVDLDPAAP
jgi:exodeoxyribonuclease-3